MKKNLLYLLMFLAMPLAFVACGDDEDGDNNNNNGITTPINATGEYDGDIEILINGENMFQAINPDITSSPISFTINQQANTTSLSINDSILILGELVLQVDGVPSTADSEKLTLNGTDMGIEKNIIGIDVVINSPEPSPRSEQEIFLSRQKHPLSVKRLISKFPHRKNNH